MEFNSRDFFSSVIISPSYLVDWDILPQYVLLPDRLRKIGQNEEEYSEYYNIKFSSKKADDGVFNTIYHSIEDNYLGSRGGLYTSKHVLVVNKQSNKIMGFSAPGYDGPGDSGGELSGVCGDNSFKQINDTLYEFKTTSNRLDSLNGLPFDEGPFYHYMHLKNGKLKALPTERIFAFTKFVKMDDSYLSGCYLLGKHAQDHIPVEFLEYAKNEIFAEYGYKFKTKKWADEFQYQGMQSEMEPKNDSVDDSLTTIDKYNINWLDKKIKSLKGKKNGSN